MRSHLYVLFAVVLIAGCGGSAENDRSAAGSPPPTSQPVSQAVAADAASGIGVGPVTRVDMASFDMTTSPRGQEIFNTKCSACHKLGERYIGPPLEGITTRRKPEWILNMILNPDTMVKEDPTAKGLLAEYLAPMTNFNLTEEEAKSVLAYFIEYDRSLAAPETEGDDRDE